MKQKLFLFILVIVMILASSCQSYTIIAARERMEIPEEVTDKETRYSVIKAEEDALIQAEQDRLAAIAAKEAEEQERLRLEAEAKAEAERLEKERLEKEAAELAAALYVYEYPEDLSTLEFPFYHNPVKSTAVKADEGIVTLKVLFLPLGEEPLTQGQADAIVASIQDAEGSLIASTGSRSNQALLATTLGYDAVSLKGGTVSFTGVSLKAMQEDMLELQITDEKTLGILMEDLKPLLPGEGDVEEVLALAEVLEDQNIDSFVDRISGKGNDARLLFLSSFAPSSEDWTDWTDFDYRKEASFAISDILSALKWFDTYAMTHYSVETDSGVTRVNGPFAERLDFIYAKEVLPVSSMTLPLEMTDSIAILAEYILP